MSPGLILSKVATNLCNPFNDMMKIFSKGVKYKPSRVMEIHKIPNVSFSNAHMIV
jgi:hypothetical protein